MAATMFMRAASLSTTSIHYAKSYRFDRSEWKIASVLIGDSLIQTAEREDKTELSVSLRRTMISTRTRLSMRLNRLSQVNRIVH